MYVRVFDFSEAYKSKILYQPVTDSIIFLRVQHNATCEESDCDRMPVMLFGDEISGWLNPSGNPAQLKELMRPTPEDVIDYYPVSREVNSPKNQDSTLIEING